MKRSSLVACLLALMGVSVVSADGVGTPQYRYVHPPKFLRSTNLPPTPGFGVKPLSEKGRSIAVYTNDIQASVSFDHGAFGFPKGQRDISISIKPLAHYKALPPGPLSLDGNVYGFTYSYLPSGAHPARSAKPVLIAMEAPHTPMQMLGFLGGRWRVLCSQRALLITVSAADCYARRLAPQVALTYKPFGPQKQRGHHKTKSRSTVPIGIIVAIAGAVILTILAGVLSYTRSRFHNPR